MDNYVFCLYIAFVTSNWFLTIWDRKKGVVRCSIVDTIIKSEAWWQNNILQGYKTFLGWSQTQNRKRYVNFENGSHFICSLNLNNPESTVFITFKMTDIATENQEFFNSLIGNINRTITAKLITFYRTYSGLGLFISKSCVSFYLAIANDGSSSIKPDLKFPSLESNCTDLNKWHLIFVTWSNKGENLSNCWYNGEKLVTFTTGNVKGSDHC